MAFLPRHLPIHQIVQKILLISWYICLLPYGHQILCDEPHLNIAHGSKQHRSCKWRIPHLVVAYPPWRLHGGPGKTSRYSQGNMKYWSRSLAKFWPLCYGSIMYESARLTGHLNMKDWVTVNGSIIWLMTSQHLHWLRVRGSSLHVKKIVAGCKENCRYAAAVSISWS